ncbi:MAG TPA: hypothetical protein VGU03_10875 [Frateuria sp.]|uniref:hypothetical protein n=1 Tax=Frateuria sp. TaxID=2211372 RepID=UPI002DF64050|nr:hypothetical protein [Frateuria sp.]
MKIGLSGGEGLRAKLEEVRQKVGKGELLRLGFLENATYPDGTPVAYIAAINEYGNPANNQPPRPFFRRMIAEKSPGWGASMAKVLKAADCNLDVAFGRMGEGIRGQLQASIRQLDAPALAAATIAAKGFEKPLVDTGHMLNSVDYDIQKAGGA